MLAYHRAQAKEHDSEVRLLLCRAAAPCLARPLMSSLLFTLVSSVYAICMQFAPNSSEPSKESNTVVVDHSETTNAKKSE